MLYCHSVFTVYELAFPHYSVVHSGVGTTGALGAGAPLYFLGLARRKSVGVAAPVFFYACPWNPPLSEHLPMYATGLSVVMVNECSVFGIVRAVSYCALATPNHYFDCE